MTKNNKDFIDEVINSTQQIKRVDAPPFLFGKIVHRIQAARNEEVYFSTPWLVRIAFAVIVMISVNALTLWSVNKKPKQQFNNQLELHKVAQEYFGSDNVSNYFY
jgi:hypothetical protein